MVTEKTIAVAGNPNVGKSTLFNALTGMKQHTGNWPGKTVSSASGHLLTKAHAYILVDIPGTYSLTPHSEEERVASDFIQSGRADAVIVVCDASCLERNMNLALQIMQVSSKVMICVNMMDEAERKNIKIDLELMSQRLGVPVIGTVARRKRSLENVTEVLDDLVDGKISCNPVKIIDCPENMTRTEMFVRMAENICSEAVTYENPQYNAFDRKLDRIFTSRITGYPVMIMLLALVFWITICGANYPSQLLSDMFGAIYIKLTVFSESLGLSWWLEGVLLDGVYKVLTWVISVMLPPMAVFFPLFTLLEDSGYLPRIAYNLDGQFKKCHACGKQALTMCMGFGCNAVGISGCRIIDSSRERLLALLTNNFVPCNGRFPALIAIITMFFAGTGGGAATSAVSAILLTVLIIFGIFMTFVVTRILSETVLKGVPSSFTLELPPYRRPQICTVIIRSVLDRTLFVLGRAVMAAAPAGVIIWIMANISVGEVSILDHCAGFLDPFAALMGMDGIILMGFILGFPANEIVLPVIIMAYMAQGSLMEAESLTQMKTLFTDNGWTPVTAICVMTFSLMHWPCATSLLTVKKETGSWKWCGLAAAIPAVAGIVTCMIINAAAYLLTDM